jgi:hypothetical protein
MVCSSFSAKEAPLVEKPRDPLVRPRGYVHVGALMSMIPGFQIKKNLKPIG